MMRIFTTAPRESQHNLDDAKKRGEMVHLLDGKRVSPMNCEDSMRLIEEALDDQEFDPSKDMIALIGSLIFNALLLSICHARYPSVRALIYDARHSNYIERIIWSPRGPKREAV